jgi:hypothetical protein
MATWISWPTSETPPVYPEPSPDADDSLDQSQFVQFEEQKRRSENAEEGKVPTPAFGAEPWRQNTSRFQQFRDVLSTDKLRERWNQATTVVSIICILKFCLSSSGQTSFRGK